MRGDFTDVLTGLAPDLPADIEYAKTAQLLVARAAIDTDGIPRAARMILVLAAGDVGDLLDDVLHGAGRSAMRAARTLIEHQVNMHTVLASPDAAERYMEHLSLGPLLLEAAPEAFFLDKTLARSVKHAARKRAKKARPRWEAAVAKYGNGFKRQWHPANLHDRSDAAGRADLYEMYRFGSSVAHGSAAGSTGQFDLHDDDVATYAAGRVPSLVPVAFDIGVEAYVQTLTHIQAAHPSLDVATAGHAMFRLVRDHSNAVQRATRKVSRNVLNRGTITAYLAFSPRGSVRWYVHDSNMPAVWRRAVTNPDLSAYEQWTAPVRAAYIEAGGPFNEGNWAAIAVGEIAINQDWSKPSIPSDVMPVVVPSEDGGWLSGTVAEHGVIVNAWIVLGPGVTSHEELAVLLERVDEPES